MAATPGSLMAAAPGPLTAGPDKPPCHPATGPLAVLRGLAFTLAWNGWNVLFHVLGFWLMLTGPGFYRRAMVWHLGVMDWIERRVLGLHLQVEGWENVPEGPVLVAAKHQSAWETFRLQILFPYCAIVMKHELTRIPFWSPMILKYGMIPVEREAGAAAMRTLKRYARERMAAGRTVVIFPQGTRTPWGIRGTYHGGVALLYADLGVPLVPVVLDSGRFWPKGCWIKRGGTVRVRALPAIPPGLKPKPMLAALEVLLETEMDRLHTDVGLSWPGDPAQREVPLPSGRRSPPNGQQSDQVEGQEAAGP